MYIYAYILYLPVLSLIYPLYPLYPLITLYTTLIFSSIYGMLLIFNVSKLFTFQSFSFMPPLSW